MGKEFKESISDINQRVEKINMNDLLRPHGEIKQQEAVEVKPKTVFDYDKPKSKGVDMTTFVFSVGASVVMSLVVMILIIAASRGGK